MHKKELRTRPYTVELPFNEISFPAFFCLYYKSAIANTTETVHEGKQRIHRDQRFVRTQILSVPENSEMTRMTVYIRCIEMPIHVLMRSNKRGNPSKLDRPTLGQCPIQFRYLGDHSCSCYQKSSFNTNISDSWNSLLTMDYVIIRIPSLRINSIKLMCSNRVIPRVL